MSISHRRVGLLGLLAVLAAVIAAAVVAAASSAASKSSTVTLGVSFRVAAAPKSVSAWEGHVQGQERG